MDSQIEHKLEAQSIQFEFNLQNLWIQVLCHLAAAVFKQKLIPFFDWTIC